MASVNPAISEMLKQYANEEAQRALMAQVYQVLHNDMVTAKVASRLEQAINNSLTQQGQS